MTGATKGQSVPAARAELHMISEVLSGIIRSLQRKQGLSEEVFALKLMADQLEKLPERRLRKTYKPGLKRQRQSKDAAPNGPALSWADQLKVAAKIDVMED